MAYDYINFICQLSSSPGLYATLSECQSAVSDGTVQPVLKLTPLWDIEKKTSMPLVINKLGDNYKQIFFEGKDQVNEDWTITSPVLTEIQCNTLLNQLLNLATKSFLWSPSEAIPYKSYTCDEWKKNRLGTNAYQIKGVFKMTILENSLLVPPLPPSPPPNNDSNVILFLKSVFNNTTNIIDSSPNAKSIDVFGTATISTAQSKYNGSSIYFDGSINCYIATPGDSIYTLGMDNFTLEMWIYPFTSSPNGIMGWNNSITLGNMVTGNPAYSDFGGSFSWWRQNGAVNALQNLTINTWQHHALVRDGNNYRWYLNGILTRSFTSTESLTGSRICIGTNAASSNFLAFAQFYLSHLRLTKAIRYTANFNPETDTGLNV